MKKLMLLSVLAFAFVVGIGSVSANGFDEFGYNNTARIFNGTGESWSLAKGLPANYLGDYAKDKLVMKWNAEWDRGNAEGWTDPNGYKAFLNNEWNGKVPGGSGETEIVKIKWVGNCDADLTLVPEGGYCIWGQFAVLMDHYTGKDNLWLAHANPTGYGAK